MSLLDIYLLGAPVLRQETTPVDALTDEHRRLIDDMFETMYAAKGIGLAAPQVGRSERLTVIDVADRPLVLVNPEIVLRDGSARAEEGCLSIPDVYGDVERATRVVVRALDREGKPFELDTDTVPGARDVQELLARCIQHELDHLHGKLFIDYLSLVKQQAAQRKWKKLRKGDRSLTRSVVPADISQHHHRDEEL
ncbi:MAG TPA: peptide deformylase [Gemmatimonadaceae bacterium]